MTPRAAQGEKLFLLAAALLAAAAALLAPASAEASRYLPQALEPVTAPQASLEDLAGRDADHLPALPALSTADRLDLVDLAAGARLEARRLGLHLASGELGEARKTASGGQTWVGEANVSLISEMDAKTRRPTFQGLWTDPVTGLAYARARWYDARNASWLSEDPLLDVDSPNLYAFVGWGPHVGTDPFGLSEIPQPELTLSPVPGPPGPAPLSSQQIEDRLCEPGKGAAVSPLCARQRARREGLEQSDREYANEVSALLQHIEESGAVTEAQRRNAALEFFREQRAPISQTDAALLVGQYLGPPSEDLLGDPLIQRLEVAGTGSEVVEFLARLEGEAAVLVTAGPLLEGLLAAGSVSRSAEYPVLYIDRLRMPNIAKNIETAIAEGHPDVLTRATARARIRANRRAALRGHQAPGSSLSLDEYPFASSYEGGAGSRVSPVPLEEQDVQGGVMSRFYQDSQIADQEAFVVVVIN